jgi:hypothetical protein
MTVLSTSKNAAAPLEPTAASDMRSTLDVPRTLGVVNVALGAARLVLYTRTGCHLCDAARAVVEKVCTAAQAGWREVDVDTDPALSERYGDYLPVVEVDGVQQGFWHLDEARLARALTLQKGVQ